jgi:hypothetical protein
MVLSEGQQRILDLIADRTNRNPSVSVHDTAIIRVSGLPTDEVNNYLGQLEGLGLIKLGIKVSGADFRLINITREGLNETDQNQGLR